MAEGSQGPFLREVPLGTVPLRRGSAQTAGANGAPSSGPWRRPGAAWPAAAPTFANIRRGAWWGESVDPGTRKGRPGR